MAYMFHIFLYVFFYFHSHADEFSFTDQWWEMAEGKGNCGKVKISFHYCIFSIVTHWQSDTTHELVWSVSATAPHPAMTWRFGFIALVVCTHFPLLVLTFSAEFNWQVVWKVLDISLQLHKKDILVCIDDVSEAISPFSFSWLFCLSFPAGGRSKNRTKFDGKIGRFPKHTEEIVERKRKRKMKLLKVFIFILFPSLSLPY